MENSNWKASEKRKFFPMNSAELLDSVFDVYKASFFKQIGVSIIFNIIISVAVYIIIFIGALVFISSAVVNSMDFSDNLGLAISVIGLIAVAFFLLMIRSAFILTGNILISKSTFFGEECTVGEAVKAVFKKFPCIFTVVIADAIISIPLFVLIFALIFVYILFIGQFAGYELFGGIEVGLFLILSVTLLLAIYILGVFTNTIVSMSYTVAIFEKKYFFSAVKKGWDLAKKDFRKIIALMAVWMLIPGATGLGLTGIIEYGASFLSGFMPDSGYSYLFDMITVINSVFSYAISALLAPLSGIFTTMLYINQRMRHEGLDLELNLSEIIRDKNRREYEERIALQGSFNEGAPVYNLKSK